MYFKYVFQLLVFQLLYNTAYTRATQRHVSVYLSVTLCVLSKRLKIGYHFISASQQRYCSSLSPSRLTNSKSTPSAGRKILVGRKKMQFSAWRRYNVQGGLKVTMKRYIQEVIGIRVLITLSDHERRDAIGRISATTRGGAVGRVPPNLQMNGVGPTQVRSDIYVMHR